MAFILPIDSDLPDSTTTLTLDDQEFDFRVRWNSFDCIWYLYIGVQNENSALKVKLTCGHDLLEPYSHSEDLPAGSLYIVDTERLYGRVGRDNLGPDKRFKILYLSEGEEV